MTNFNSIVIKLNSVERVVVYVNILTVKACDYSVKIC
jgi:hypothetical protein